MMVANLLAKFRVCRSGATSIEYGLIAALLTLGLIGAMTIWGQEASGMYESLAEGGWGDGEAGDDE